MEDKSISLGEDGRIGQSLRNRIRFIGTQHNLHKPKGNHVLVLSFCISVLEQEEEYGNFEGNEGNGEENNEAEVAELIDGGVADGGGRPLGAGVHDQPHQIQHNAGDNESQGEPDVDPVEKIHQVDREQAGQDDKLNKDVGTLRKSYLP